MVINKNEKQYLLVLVIPLLLVIAATIIAFALGYTKTAGAIAPLGTVGVLALAGIYVVFIDSRRRWPQLTSLQRLMKVLTFQR